MSIHVVDKTTGNTTPIPGTVDTNFEGTRTQWNAMTQAQQDQYDTVDFKDDYNGITMDDTPTQNSENTVKSGGVFSWVKNLGYITGLAWSALTGKPFSTVGSGLTVTSDTLTADVQSASVEHSGTASSSAYRRETITINGSANSIDRTLYMEQTKTLSTSASTTYTFSNSAITANSLIEVFSSIWGIVPSSVTVSSGSCTVTIPKYSSAASLKVRIYIT